MREITKIEAVKPADIRLKRVAAYARVSSGKDAMIQSLSAQISYYNSYITSNPKWSFAGVYADEAITGTKEQRPEFQRMLTDCRSGKIDMVIAKSITRFARNTVTLLETIRELKSLGVDVFFEKENVHTMSEDGEFVLTLLAMYAQEESRSASENQRWRIQKKFEQGIPNTRNTYGYRLKNGKLEIEPEEAKIVCQIFQDYISGMGRTAIVKKLRESKAPTRYGGKWHESTIYEILRNEAYIGNLLLQKTYRVDFLTKKHVVNHGERPMYQVIGSHQAIVDEQTFALAQEEISKRSRSNKTTQNIAVKQYPFSGLIHCGKCGATYRRKISNAGSKYSKPVWICNTFNRFGKESCSSKQIPEDILCSLTTEVLGLSTLGSVNLSDYLTGITINEDNSLSFSLIDGTTKDITWQNHSRSESWTPEMKEKARQKTLQNLKERSAKNGNHQQD